MNNELDLSLPSPYQSDQQLMNWQASQSQDEQDYLEEQYLEEAQ